MTLPPIGKVMPIMVRKRLIKILAVAFGLAAAGLVPAHATITTTLVVTDSAGDSVTIADGGIGSYSGHGPGYGADSNPNANTVTWVGTIGNWYLNVDTGVLDGNPTAAPNLDVSFLDDESTGPGTLTITFTATGLGPLPADTAAPQLSFGGTTDNGEVTYNALINSSETTIGPLTGPSFSGDKTGAEVGGLLSTFTMVQSVVIDHTTGGSTSGDARFTIIPEPTTMLAGALLLLPFGLSTLRPRGIGRRSA